MRMAKLYHEKSGFHTGFFCKFGAHLRTKLLIRTPLFKAIIIIPFILCSFRQATPLLKWKLVKTSPSTIKPYIIVHRLSFKILGGGGGGGTFAGEGNPCPPPLYETLEIYRILTTDRPLKENSLPHKCWSQSGPCTFKHPNT